MNITVSRPVSDSQLYIVFSFNAKIKTVWTVSDSQLYIVFSFNAKIKTVWTNVGDIFLMTGLLITVINRKWILLSLNYEREKTYIKKRPWKLFKVLLLVIWKAQLRGIVGFKTKNILASSYFHWVACDQYQKFIPVVNLFKRLSDCKRSILPITPPVGTLWYVKQCILFSVCVRVCVSV